MSGRRGRPRADRVALLERIVAELAESPEATANELARRLRARRTTVLRIVRALRAGEQPHEASLTPATRFP